MLATPATPMQRSHGSAFASDLPPGNALTLM